MRTSIVTLLLLVAYGSAKTINDPVRSFIELGGTCAEKLNLDPDLFDKVKKLEFPDMPEIHEFLICLSTEFEVWNDKTGYDLDRITEFLKILGKPELMTDEVRSCNSNEQNDPVGKWIYRSFSCMFKSPAGTFFMGKLKEFTSGV